ncbi:MAG: transglutaminase-like domain-containing protein [Planctomycetaceae bacterium]|nr:transglutaminase-like domain-containing protein [Planctomycetaceae bacterium]
MFSPRRCSAIVSCVFALLVLTASWSYAPAAGLEPARPAAATATFLGSDSKRVDFGVPNSPLEKQLLDDAADGRLDRFSPLDAALVAGGITTRDELDRYRRKADALVERLQDSDELPEEPRPRAEAIFNFLHREIFCGGYDLAYTDLRRVLDEGRFNCVSATVLFNYLAERLGLRCCGLEMPGHAMSRVRLPEGPLDIENTYSRWQELPDAPSAPTARGAAIGAATSGDRSKAREVSPIQLAAMVYYNRGVDRLAAKRFDEAAAANAKALRLDPGNAVARQNFLATLNNWSIELGNAGRFGESVALLRRGLAVDPHFAAFAQNYVHVHRLWVEQLCRQQRTAEAAKLLAQAVAEMPDREDLRRIESDVRRSLPR